MRAASELLTSAMDTLTRSTGFSHRAISLDVLEGVAKMRYALFVVAKLLQLQINEMGGALASHTQKLLYGSVASNLLEEAKYVLSICITTLSECIYTHLCILCSTKPKQSVI